MTMRKASRFGRSRRMTVVLLSAAIIGQTSGASAQKASNGARGDGLDARIDAILATPTPRTPPPTSSVVPTPPSGDRKITSEPLDAPAGSDTSPAKPR